MRRPLLVALGVGLLASSTALAAYAQSSAQREDDAKRAAQDSADKKKKQKEKEWTLSNAPLPDVKERRPVPLCEGAVRREPLCRAEGRP